MRDIIFLCDKKNKINEIYPDEILNEYGLIDKIPIFDKSDIVANVRELSEVRVIFSTWNMPEFTEDEIKTYLPSLKAVFYAAGTVKYFAEPFLKCGVRVFSARKDNGIPVAEFTVAQIILANKGYFQAQRAYKLPTYSRAFGKGRNYSNRKTGNYRSTVGVVGAGMVGKRVIELLQYYNLKIYAYDPYVSEDVLKAIGAQKCDLETLIKESDVISNHLPDIQDTKNLFDYELLSKMKSTATFINTGRGAQVVEGGLIKAMKEEPLRCAVLDVTSHEPLLPWSAVYRCKNIFVTPHIAGSTGNEVQRMGETMLQAFRDFEQGKNNDAEVTLNMLDNMA